MGDQPSDRIDHDDFPPHFLCITQSRRRSDSTFSIVNSQQNSGIVYQEAVALKHTIFVVGSADIDKRNRPIQNRIIKIS